MNNKQKQTNKFKTLALAIALSSVISPSTVFAQGEEKADTTANEAKIEEKTLEDKKQDFSNSVNATTAAIETVETGVSAVEEAPGDSSTDVLEDGSFGTLKEGDTAYLETAPKTEEETTTETAEIGVGDGDINDESVPSMVEEDTTVEEDKKSIKEEKVKELDNEIENLNKQSTEKQEIIENDKKDLVKKEDKQKEVQKNLEDATNKFNDLKAKKEEIEKDKNATQEDLDSVTNEYNEIKDKYEKAKNNASTVTEKEKARLNELADVYENSDLAGMRFFKQHTDDKMLDYEIKNYAEAGSGLEGKDGNEMSLTEMAQTDGEKDSAFGIDNMISATKAMIRLNNQRKEHNLKPLPTSYYAQFLANVSVEGAKRTGTHYKKSSSGGGENLVMSTNMQIPGENDGGYTNPFVTWYTREEGVFLKVAKQVDPDAKLDTDAERVAFANDPHNRKAMKEIAGIDEWGHYIALLRSDKAVNQGMAFGSTIDNGEGYLDIDDRFPEYLNNIFLYPGNAGFYDIDIDSKLADEYGMYNVNKVLSPEELLEELEEFKKTDSQLKKEYQELKNKVDNDSGLSQAEFAKLKDKMDSTQEKMDSLKEKLAKSAIKVDELNNQTNKAKSDKEKLEEEILAINKDINTMKAKINKDIDEVNEIKDLIDAAKLSKANLTKTESQPETGKEDNKEDTVKVEKEEKIEKLDESEKLPETKEELEEQAEREKDESTSKPGKVEDDKEEKEEEESKDKEKEENNDKVNDKEGKSEESEEKEQEKESEDNSQQADRKDKNKLSKEDGDGKQQQEEVKEKEEKTVHPKVTIIDKLTGKNSKENNSDVPQTGDLSSTMTIGQVITGAVSSFGAALGLFGIHKKNKKED